MAVEPLKNTGGLVASAPQGNVAPSTKKPLTQDALEHLRIAAEKEVRQHYIKLAKLNPKLREIIGSEAENINISFDSKGTLIVSPGKKLLENAKTPEAKQELQNSILSELLRAEATFELNEINDRKKLSIASINKQIATIDKKGTLTFADRIERAKLSLDCAVIGNKAEGILEATQELRRLKELDNVQVPTESRRVLYASLGRAELEWGIKKALPLIQANSEMDAAASFANPEQYRKREEYRERLKEAVNALTASDFLDPKTGRAIGKTALEIAVERVGKDPEFDRWQAKLENEFRTAAGAGWSNHLNKGVIETGFIHLTPEYRPGDKSNRAADFYVDHLSSQSGPLSPAESLHRLENFTEVLPGLYMRQAALKLGKEGDATYRISALSLFTKSISDISKWNCDESVKKEFTDAIQKQDSEYQKKREGLLVQITNEKNADKKTELQTKLFQSDLETSLAQATYIQNFVQNKVSQQKLGLSPGGYDALSQVRGMLTDDERDKTINVVMDTISKQAILLAASGGAANIIRAGVSGVLRGYLGAAGVSTSGLGFSAAVFVTDAVVEGVAFETVMKGLMRTLGDQHAFDNYLSDCFWSAIQFGGLKTGAQLVSKGFGRLLLKTPQAKELLNTLMHEMPHATEYERQAMAVSRLLAKPQAIPLSQLFGSELRKSEIDQILAIITKSFDPKGKALMQRAFGPANLMAEIGGFTAGSALRFRMEHDRWPTDEEGREMLWENAWTVVALKVGGKATQRASEAFHEAGAHVGQAATGKGSDLAQPPKMTSLGEIDQPTKPKVEVPQEPVIRNLVGRQSGSPALTDPIEEGKIGPLRTDILRRAVGGDSNIPSGPRPNVPAQNLPVDQVIDRFDRDLKNAPGYQDLPPQFFERYRILNPNLTPQAIEHCQAILDKLSGLPDFPNGVPKFRILFSDAPGAAFVWHNRNDHSNPPTIVISRDFYNGLKNEAELAFVLYHEVAHPTLAPRKLHIAIEELGADVLAAKWMNSLNYDWEASVDLLKRFSTKDPATERMLSILDEHSHPDDRIKAIMSVLGKRSLKGDDQMAANPVRPPIPENLLTEVNKPQKLTFIETLKANAGYDALDLTGKIEFLETLLPRLISSEGERVFGQNSRRLEEYMDEIDNLESLCKSENLPEVKAKAEEALNRFADSILDLAAKKELGENMTLFISCTLQRIGQGLHRLDEQKYEYPSTSWKLDYYVDEPVTAGYLRPVGRLRQLDSAVKIFLAADQPAEALAASEKLLEAYKQNGANINPSVLQIIVFGGLSPEGIWAASAADKAVKTLIDLAQNDKSGQIARALWLCGIRGDDRIWDLIPDVRTNPDAAKEPRLENWILDADRKLDARRSREILPRLEYYREQLRDQSKGLQLPERIENLRELIAANAKFLSAPTEAALSAPSAYTRLTMEEAYSRHNQYIRQFLDYIQKQIADEPNQARRDELKNQLMEAFSVNFPELAKGGVHKKLDRNANMAHQYQESGALVDFIIKDPLKLFNRVDKTMLLGEMLAPESQSKDAAWWRNKVGYHSPQDLSQLNAFLAESPRISFSAGSGGEMAFNILKEIHTAEVFAFKAPVSSAEAYGPEGIKLLTMLDEGEGNIFVNSGKNPARKTLQRIFLGENRGAPLEAGRPPTNLSLEAMTKLFTVFDSQTLFKDVETRRVLESRLIEAFKNEKDSMLQRKMLEKVLDGNSVNVSPGLRDFVIERWSKSIADQLGKDDGSEAYSRRFLNVAGVMFSGNGLGTTRLLAAAVLDKIQSQRNLSYRIRDILEGNAGKSELEGALVKSAGFLIETVRKDKDGRAALVDFLTTPLTDESVEKAVNVQRQILRKNSPDWRDSNESSAPTEENVLLNIGDSYRRLHTLLWSLPSEYRAVALDNLILPPSELAGDRTKATKEAIGFVLDRLFPDAKHSKLSAADQRENDVTRRFLESYIESSHPTEQGLLLGAFMAGSLRIETEKTSSPGARLATILGFLGPAYVKAGQAAHSHPDTPEHIKKNLESLKGQAAPPVRWELWERIDETLPAELRNRITFVGEVLGSASFFINAEIRYKSGLFGREKEGVVGLLRENARQQAETGFNRLEETARKFAQTDPEFRDGSRLIIEMVRQAREMSLVETDLKIGSQQAQTAQELYGDVKVRVGKRYFELTVAKWSTYGQEYRITDKVEGVHFLDLPEQTAEQREYKKAVAKAYFAVEMLNILRGKKFDVDRHGAQIRVSGQTIGIYDHGGMTLKDPTPAEKAQFGELLTELVKGGGKVDAAKLMSDRIEAEFARTGKRPEFLMNVQKAFLAMGDFTKYLSAKDKKDVFMGVLANLNADPAMIGGAVTRLDRAGLWLANLRGALEVQIWTP